MADIARLSGVSKPTVSRVMSGSPLVTEETRQRVLEIAREHGYTVNDNARRLWLNRANTIGVVLDLPSLPQRRVSEPFHFEILADLLHALNDARQDALVVGPSLETAEQFADLIASKRVDGVIFVGQGKRQKVFSKLAKRGVPFVVWGAADPSNKYVSVGSDNIGGGRLVADRFLALGRSRILFVGPLEHPEIRQRHEGLAERLGSMPKIAVSVVEPDDLSFEASEKAINDHLHKLATPPDAIFCGSDTMALAVLGVLRRNRIKVPAQTSLIGYDDIPAAGQHVPGLTTIRQDTALAGGLLVDRIMQLISGERAESTYLPTRLIIRET
jgi:DNA-binding LacI/PurR family transcriptional regulator